jgi:penicillin-insensitive murein endopeptidase
MLSGCAGPLFGDGTSISLSLGNQTALRRGARLAADGDGYVIPPTWRARGAAYGTDELVDTLVRTARAVARAVPGGTLGVADLSPRGGGPTVKHRSHAGGRDVDLIYYSVDTAGRPLRPADAMLRYGPDGASRPFVPESPGDVRPAQGWEATPRRFDVERNWALVKALLGDAEIEIQWIFIAEMLRDRLLDYATRIGEPPELIERAALLLHRPTDSQPHDDHMHLRILCDPADREFGCIDRGPVRWWKKHYKYMEPARARMARVSLPAPLDQMAVAPAGLFAVALGGR